MYDLSATRYEPPRRRRHTVWIVLGIFLAVCCAGAGISVLSWTAAQRNGDPGAVANIGSSDDPGNQAPANPAARPTSPKLNDPVRDGVFEFTVLSVSCGHDQLVNGWLHAEPQGQFCVVQMRVRNIGSQPQRFGDGLQKAYGPDGTSYAADTGAGVVANGNGDAIWNVVNPGNSVTAKVVFDIPRSATITAIELHDSLFSRGIRVRLSRT